MVRDYKLLATPLYFLGVVYLVELVLQLSLRTLRTRTNSLRIIFIESSTWLRMIQLWPIFIIARNQERHTKRSTHDTLLTISALTKSQSQITNSLRTALDSQRLIVMESMVLRLDASVLDHRSCIGLESGHRTSYVAVDFDDLFDGRGLEEGRGHALFDSEDDASARGHADCG